MTPRNDLMYLKLLQSLLPKGKMWARSSSATLTKLLYGLAGEYARIESRGFDLFNESLISQVNELLEEYENDYGVYEDNIELGKTIQERIDSIITKFLSYGATHKSYFEDIATELGYTIIIDEYKPAWSGVFASGDPCGILINLFWWKCNITIEYNINYNIERIMYEISKFKPAHTHLVFDFYGAEFSRGFDCSFDSMPEFDNSWGGNGYGKIGDGGLDFSRDFSIDFANAYDYDGNNYIGAFDYAFDIGFDRYSGGDFAEVFSDDFSRPH